MRRSLLLVLAATLAACGPTVAYDRAPDAPIPAGARWAWGPPDQDGLSRADGAQLPADSISRAIRAAVEAELVAKGFPLAPAESAQLLLHFHVGQRHVSDTLPPRDDPAAQGGVRVPGEWGGYGRPEDLASRTVTWEEGMLVVDAVLADRGVVAWRGLIAGEIPPEAMRRPGPSIREAVKRLMRGFP